MLAVNFDKRRPPLIVSIGGGVLITLGVMLMVPISQFFSIHKQAVDVVTPIDVVVPPPPMPELPSPPEEPPTEEIIDVSTVLPPLPLEQLDVALNPGPGDAMEQSFSFDTFEINQAGLGSFKIYEISEMDQIPRPLYRAEPVYPRRYNRPGFSEKVIIVFIVDERGRVYDPSVESSTHSGLNEPSLDAIKKWRFEPGVKEGVRVKVRMRVPFIFQYRR